MSSSAAKPEVVSENVSLPAHQQSDTQQQLGKQEAHGEHRKAPAHEGSKSPRRTGTATHNTRKTPTSEVHRSKRDGTPSSPSSTTADLADIGRSHRKSRKDDSKGRNAARALATDRQQGAQLDSAVPPLAHRRPSTIHGSPAQDLATRALLVGSYAMCIGIIAVCVVALIRALTITPDTAALSTSSGIVYGKRVTTASGVRINQFLGVPYALDTSGSRRFMDPVPLARFPREMWKAQEPIPACTQWLSGSAHGSEDCLRLSIWAPAKDDDKHKKSLVLALTGDWFQTGNTASDGAVRWAELAADMNGVVVAPNHRLGVFGFLDVGVRGMLGNVALQDVLLAMSWVDKNAGALNVDTDNMAAFGLGSGAFILSLLLMSSSSANDTLFRRAFLQGPCPTAPIPRNTPEIGRAYMAQMSRDLGCYQPRIADQADCLRSVTQELLLEASLNLGPPIRFVPSALNGETLSSLQETAYFDGVEFLLGSDVSDGKRLYDDVIIPLAKESRNSTNVRASDVFDSLRYFLTNNASGLDAASREAALNVVAPNEMAQTIVHLFTTCASKKMAAAVSARNGTLYHYVTKGESVNDVPLEMTDIANFLSKGVVPQLKNGSSWPSYEAENFSRIFPESAGNGADVIMANICDSAERLLPYL
ncbi:hypothetical protein MTO96_038371 [Rhipicephalus appendiculatus]